MVFQGDGLCFGFYHLVSPLHAMYSLRSYVLWLRGGDPRELDAWSILMMASVQRSQKCSAAMRSIVSDLDRAGFILNAQKSRLEPQQVGTWLGFTLDLVYGAPGKRERLVASIVLHSLCTSIGGIVGQVISMSLAIGPVARLRTSALYQVINIVGDSGLIS